MGRKAKILTEFEKECRKKSADRLKALKDEQRITYKTLAENIGVAEATVRNYVHLRSTMNREIAHSFQQYTGIIWQYWIGETDCKTLEEYQIEQFEAASEAYNEIQEDERRRIGLYRAIFDSCGFQYENVSYTPAYEFNPEAEGSHRITNRDAPKITAVFSDSEINDLFSRLHDMIEFECYKKSNRERGEKKCHQ